MSDLPYRPGVGIMLVNASGHVFVGQRFDSVVEAWQMPQGGIDPGEDPYQAALRELEEETGVKAHLTSHIAETADWVAMASEYRALAGLPGVEQARIWEPEPEVVYAWTR